MVLRCAIAIVGALAFGGLSVIPAASEAAESAKTSISSEAKMAVEQMGKTLAAKDFSFRAQTIRVYEDDNGQLLHIFHSINVLVHRPDRLRVQVIGDDGSPELFYDGKTVAILGLNKKKYVQVAAPNTIAAALNEVMNKFGADFPLADLLAPAPDKAFLSGVLTGRQVNIVTIGGAAYRHLFFSQPPGLELELWVDKTDKALPRRLIVTYRLLPGQPNFIAEFSDWKFGTPHPDAEFAFTAPAGATKIDLKPDGSQ